MSDIFWLELQRRTYFRPTVLFNGRTTNADMQTDTYLDTTHSVNMEKRPFFFHGHAKLERTIHPSRLCSWSSAVLSVCSYTSTSMKILHPTGHFCTPLAFTQWHTVGGFNQCLLSCHWDQVSETNCQKWEPSQGKADKSLCKGADGWLLFTSETYDTCCWLQV